MTTFSNFDRAFERVKQLAADFKANEHFYLSPLYQEAEARRDFIDKFLIALGWDVNHDTQKNPYEQEVKVERKEHGVSQRRADYAFYLAPNFRDVKFYIEAKKPYGDIATMDNYFQTVRYGWNSKTAIAALFDFAQFEIVDCRYKPDLETALQRNLKKFHYSQFSDKEVFAQIYWLFSREAVARGSLEKYAEALPKRRGAVQRGRSQDASQSIDDAFLEELDAHRETLAHIFKNSNPTLDGETLTEVTQRTLDRLVFMRFLEDKLIETQYLVANFGEHGSAWGDFIATSKRLDGIYNGIVFKQHDILDKQTFKVDDAQFAKICRRLCQVNSIYDFNAIPIHILGSIYERFLGKVIVATGKRARVEEKPEVRKAGGVYYTPEYIVHYIVANTVGKLIAGKTPAQIAEMRFADIACGSGSFLLGVYDLLMRRHTKFYNENPSRARMGDVVERDDGLHLSLEKKRDILLNNIYGVDIDRQAVEVAQLSLYLKLLQDETPSSARTYQLEFHETLLPSLNKNIVCGNSLIGREIMVADFFENGDTERKLNPMNFDDAFPQIMKRGGFDAIIGNPPWGGEFGKIDRRYLVEKFPQVPTKTKDSYFYFIFRTLEKMRNSGMFGYVVPNTWLLINSAKGIREQLLRYDIGEIRDYGDGVFKDATVESSTLILSKAKGTRRKCHAVRLRKGRILVEHDVDKSIWLNDEYSRIILDKNREIDALLSKLKSRSRPFGETCTITWGIKPYQVGYGEPPQTREMVEKRIYHGETKRGSDWKPLLVGSDVNRYTIKFPGNQYIKYGKWLMYPSNETLMRSPKLLMRQTSDTLRCGYDENGFYCQNSVFIVHSRSVPLKLLLAVLNSSLLGFVYRLKNPQTGKVFAEIKPSTIKELPIFQHETLTAERGKTARDIVALVEQLLTSKKQLAGARSDRDKDFYGNKCAALDRQIDMLVYDLYGLTEEEKAIVQPGEA